jgi:uncharacterized protein (TIGR03000 family)
VIASANTGISGGTVIASASSGTSPGLTPTTDAERAAVQKVLAGMRSKSNQNGSGGDTTAVASAAPARITVRVPASAKLFVDDQACPLGSEVRTFRTPELRPGRQYYYTIRAEVDQDGETRTATRQVTFRAGQEVNVTFSDLMTVATARR